MNNIYIILVEPVYRGNVGSVSRIMNNFCCSNLRIIRKIPDKDDYVLGVHSEHILESAEIFPDLLSAIKDLDRVVALSRRIKKKRQVDYNPLHLSQQIHQMNNLKIGLVFGRETWGLTVEESNLCPLRCYIPANKDFPSLNLAQAVTVILYEIYAFQWKNQTKISCGNRATIDESKDFVMKVLDNIHFFKNGNKDLIEDFLENLFYRSNLNKTMAFRVKQIFNRIHVLITGSGTGFKKNKEK